MSKIEKVKKFVKENKKAIIVGTICTAVGACCGWKIYELSNDGLRAKAVLNMKHMTAIRDAVMSADDATGFSIDFNNMRYDNAWDECIECMKDVRGFSEFTDGYDPTGVTIFVKKK